MGKTKTAVMSGIPDELKSSKEVYEEKRRKQEERKKKETDLPGQPGVKKKQIKGVGLKGGERIKTIEAGPIIEEPSATETDLARKVEKKPRARGKKYSLARARIDKTKAYPLTQAIELIKETSYSKFDGSFELHMLVKKDLSEKITLPHSTGKEKKIEVADDSTIKKLKAGKTGFDILLATPDMMPKLVPFAKILGPKGLMPNPKNGTLIKDKDEARKFSPKTLVVKTEKKQPIVHTVVGKVSQKNEEIEENLNAIIESIGGKQIVRAFLKATMSPSIRLQIQ